VDSRLVPYLFQRAFFCLPVTPYLVPVQVGTGRGAVMPYDWKSNLRFGVTLARHHRRVVLWREMSSLPSLLMGHGTVWLASFSVTVGGKWHRFLLLMLFKSPNQQCDSTKGLPTDMNDNAKVATRVGKSVEGCILVNREK